MHKPLKTTLAMLLALVACQLTPAPTAAQEDPEARKAKILANLKLAFPQLEELEVDHGRDLRQRLRGPGHGQLHGGQRPPAPGASSSSSAPTTPAST